MKSACRNLEINPGTILVQSVRTNETYARSCMSIMRSTKVYPGSVIRPKAAEPVIQLSSLQSRYDQR